MEQRDGHAHARATGASAGQSSRDIETSQSPSSAWTPQAGHHQHPQASATAGGGPSTSILPAIPSDPSAKEQQQAAKQSLKQWWTKFTKQQQQQSGYAGGSSSSSSVRDGSSASGVFGVPLTESLKYAGVAISMVGPDGINQVYGYIPIVVAKCGLFLKQKATTVEGVFRISGSTRRMKELQDIFDRPPSYGRDVVWGPWSVHDAASVLRRYLNQMHEPVVPYELYDEFRNALPPVDKVKDPVAINASILRYKALIACLPSSSKYLLCYVLDLLNVFHRHHTQNLMPAANLAVVFQPGLIRPPDTPLFKPNALPGASEAATQSSEEALAPPNMPHLSRVSSNPLVSRPMTKSMTNDSKSNTTELQRRQDEIKIDQEVLEFLINHQDHFVALPDMSSSTETSPVSPVSNQSRGSFAGQSSVPVTQQQQQTQKPESGQKAAKNYATTPQKDALPSTQPLKPSQPSSGPTAPAATPLPFPQPSGHPRSEGPARQAHNPPPQRELQRPPQAPARTGSPAPFRGQEGRETMGGSSPLLQMQDSPVQPQSQARAQPQFRPQPSASSSQGRSSPVQVLGPQQTVARPSKSKDREKQTEDRKPRKLKKGRTPTSSSGTNTPLSPPPVVAWDPSSPVPPMQYHRSSGPQHSSSTPPVGIVHDDDTPLSQGMAAAGPGVKRSRTLPSPGDKGSSSARLVSGRRGSDSRAAPPSSAAEGRLSVDGRPTTAPSPLRSPIPRAPPSPLASQSHPAQSAADVEGEQSESSDAQTGSTGKKKNAGWRRAFKKDREREHFLLAPTLASLQDSALATSNHSAEDTGRKGSIQESMSIQTQNRRPSASSAAPTDYSETSGQTQLRAVRNPPLHGHGKEGGGSMSKRHAKKVAEQTPEFSVEAIRDAVSNIGR